MSTPNTASNFINVINQNYPVAGRDNDTQGFRNNFTNIKQALTWLDNDVYDLQVNTVKRNQDNDFVNNLIKRATFQDCATKIYDTTDSVTTGDVITDYENGSYQKFKLSAGFHTFTFINWPDTSKTGRLTLSLISDSITGSTVNFGAYQVINLGPDVFPINVSGTTPKIFEIWNDGDSGAIFVQSSRNVDQESTLTANIQTLVLGGTNTYNTVTNSYAPFATSIRADSKAGNLALVPNKIFGIVLNADLINVDPGNNTATGFKITSTNGLLQNATFDLPLSTSTVKFNVTSFTTDTVYVSPPFETTALNIGNTITFVNPTFNDQPKVATFKTTAQSTTTSAPNDLQGTIYANSTTFYVAHSDHAYNTQNWLKITADHMPQHLVEGSTAVTMTATNSSTFIATTAHVKNAIDSVLPKGMITLWYGSIVSIPTGWALCNGTNGTPDLRDRFVVGAGTSYTVGATGGATTSTFAGNHNHTAVLTSASLVVSNIGWGEAGLPLGAVSSGQLLVGSGDPEVGEALESIRASGNTLTLDEHNHNITINNNGTHNHDVTPPYYALCYIMKL